MYDYSSKSLAERRRKKRRRKAIRNRIIFALVCLLLLTGLFFGIKAAVKGIKNALENKHADETGVSSESTLPDETGTDADETGESTEPTEESTKAPLPEAQAKVLNQAKAMALQYDYEGAVALLKSVKTYESIPEYLEAIAAWEEVIPDLVELNTGVWATTNVRDLTTSTDSLEDENGYVGIPHIFFHSLIADTNITFSLGERDNYNQVMTTIKEFREILQQLYDNDYVLIKIHDLYYTDAQGNFVHGSIKLPKGKKPIIISVDDVSYYEYMMGDGFASRIVIGDDGLPTCEMDLADGTTVTGEYDVVPILESFLAEHPDFSYKGARCCIALTGYDGILGYRTEPKYADRNWNGGSDWKDWYAGIDVEKEKKAATKVAARMKELGYEFASHSWGHINMTNDPLETIQNDMSQWMERVDPLLGGGTDILIFAFGADIGDWLDYDYTWQTYPSCYEKYEYLHSLGFHFFINVDNSWRSWMQVNETCQYVRMGRLSLDGEAFYYNDEYDDKLRRYLGLDIDKVWDDSRPTPVKHS